MSSTTTPTRSLQEQTEADLYNSDVYSWSVKQAAALRRRDFAAVDWDNVIEEIEDVGKSEKRTWTSLCTRTIEHLLRIEHYREATKETLKKWEAEIRQFRRDMCDTIVDNPSLQAESKAMFAKAWRRARNNTCDRLAQYDEQNNRQLDFHLAKRQRDLILPDTCPYRFEDVTAFKLQRSDRNPQPDDKVWPPQVARVLNERCGPAQEREWSR